MIRKIWLDVILATLFIFGIGAVIDNASALKVFDVFDPIGEAFDDMEFTDIVFSQLREAPVPDERIVLVNVSNLDRAGIGEMLNIINNYDPKVVGFDLRFITPRDEAVDSILENAFANTDKLILPSRIFFDYNGDREKDSIEYSLDRFMRHASDTGFVNILTEASEQEDLKMIREFLPHEVVKGVDQYSFPVKMAEYFAPEKVEKLLARRNPFEVINYRGNVFDYGASEFGTLFYALDVPDVFGENFLPEVVKDKIIIFCFLGEYLGDRKSLEDKVYTPINSNYIGRAYPDMFGGVVHANTISMILNEDYVDEMGEYTSYILAVILCLMNVALFSIIYIKLPRWYDGITKLIQLVEIMSLVFVIILVFDKFSYKLDLIPSLAVIALSGDLLEVYYGVIKNAFTREGRREMKEVNKL